jgi:hypothetical protein
MNLGFSACLAARWKDLNRAVRTPLIAGTGDGSSSSYSYSNESRHFAGLRSRKSAPWTADRIYRTADLVATLVVRKKKNDVRTPGGRRCGVRGVGALPAEVAAPPWLLPSKNPQRRS